MKIFISLLILLTTTATANAQQLKSLIKKAKETVAGNGQLGAQDIASGLKEALAIGAEKGAATLSKEN